MDPLFSTTAVAAEASTGGLPAWERLMRRGVDASRRGHIVLAEGLYLQALGIAEPLLEAGGSESADNRVAAFVVTHLNLADLHRDADRTEDAVAHLCTAHRTLMALLREGQTEPALQQAACRHSRETHAALISHLGEHGAHPAILAALRAGCMPFPPPGVTLH
jgi:hypothetical protein